MINPGKDTEEARQQFEKESAENVVQLYNYPSIVTWVLFNEKWGQYDQQRLTKWLKEADPTRLINGHSGEMLYVNNKLRSESPNAWIGADMTDVHAYPMPGHIKFQKDKAAVLGEFGGIGVPIENHLWDDLIAGWGYDGVVTPKKMEQQYSQMIDSLKNLETQGLTASIYTQPFDVESEQNGIMTYDREVIKLDFATLRAMHKRLLPAIVDNGVKNDLSVKVAEVESKDYQARLKDYERGNRDVKFLRNLAILAVSAKDLENAAKIFNTYVDKLNGPLTESILKFIIKFAYSSESKGYVLIRNNLDKVNNILGDNKGSRALMTIIHQEAISPRTENKKDINWDVLMSDIVGKYGAIAREKVLETKVMDSYNNNDLKNVIAGADEWFNMKNSVLTNADGMNNCAWRVFEACSDKNTLKKASKWCEKALLLEPDHVFTIDTYANLLHKIGRTSEAITWEKKAIELNPNEQIYKDTLKKMEKGYSTWPEEKN